MDAAKMALLASAVMEWLQDHGYTTRVKRMGLPDHFVEHGTIAEGRVIMYADVVTDSMRRAIDETSRRRQVQQEYNQAHGIVPKTIIKPVKDLIELTLVAESSGEYKVDVDATARAAAKKLQVPGKKMTKKESEALLKALMKEMQMASRSLEFERAAQLRDMIFELEDAFV